MGRRADIMLGNIILGIPGLTVFVGVLVWMFGN
jgi:hypothetical protein